MNVRCHICHITTPEHRDLLCWPEYHCTDGFGWDENYMLAIALAFSTKWDDMKTDNKYECPLSHYYSSASGPRTLA